MLNRHYIPQPRTLILGLGNFGLRSQVHLWKRLMYAVELRRQNFPFLAPPQDFINFLTLRVSASPVEITLYRPNLEKWREISRTESKYNFVQPSLDELNSIFSETMDRCPMGWMSVQKSQARRSDVFSNMIALRTPLLQQFREALFLIMSDRITQPNVAQVHVIVIADITDELDSALLWPTLALLNEALSEYQNSDLSVFLKTATYSPAPMSTAERAIAYLTLRELEFFSNWEMISLLPSFMKELLPNRYWAKFLRRVLFDRCYLMDNIKFRDNRSTSLQDIVISLGNIIEAMVMTDLQQVIRERLEPNLLHLVSLKHSKFAPRGDQVASEEYEKGDLLIEGWEYPYGDTKMLYRRGIFSGIGAATIYMPIDKLDAWGKHQVYQQFFDQYLHNGKQTKSEDSEALWDKSFVQEHGLTLKGIASWLENEISDGDFQVIHSGKNEGLKISWHENLIKQDIYSRKSSKEWLKAVDDLWNNNKYSRKSEGLQGKLERIRSHLTDRSIPNRKKEFLTGFRHEILTLLINDNNGVLDALTFTAALKDIVDENINLLVLRQQELNFDADKRGSKRNEIKADFEGKWRKRSILMNIALKLYDVDLKIAQLFRRSANKSSRIFVRLSRFLARDVEKEWRKYYDTALYEASTAFEITILELLEHELYQPLSNSLEKTIQALKGMLERLNSEREAGQKKISNFNLEYSHFLRSYQTLNTKMLDKLYESWSEPIFDSIKKKPLLKASIREINDSFEHFFNALSENISEIESRDYGQQWADLLLNELQFRIQRYSGRWFHDQFMLEMELVRGKEEYDINQEVAMLRRKAQPFIRIESDMFEHEVTSLEFITLFDRAQSLYFAKEAEEYRSTVLNSWDPYTITYIQTYHGLNVWILPFVEFYRKEFQILNDDDRARLMLHPEMDDPQYGFAKRVPEIQLHTSVFDAKPVWQLPYNTEGNSDE